MTLRTRLMLMALVPLIGLVALATSLVANRFSLANDVRHLAELVAVSTRVGALAHELQKERGMSAGFLGSRGSNFAVELPQQRELSEKRRQELNNALSAFDATYFGAALVEQIKVTRALVDGLPDKRKAVTALTIPAPEAIGYYSKTISGLLAIVEKLDRLSPDREIAQQAVAYHALLQAKERAGIERATLTNTFGENRFSQPNLVRFISNSAEQDMWFGVFRQYASAGSLSFANEKLQGTAVDAVAAMKKVAFDNLKSESLGVDAKQWFAAATGRIDLLKAVEDHQATQIERSMEAVARQSMMAAWIFTAATLLIAAVILFMTLRITRRILAQLGGEPETAVNFAHAVAEGNLDNQVELRANDDASILASMVRMQNDLRSRIESERAVAAENLRVRIALDNVSTGVMIADSERNIIYTNASVVRILREAEADLQKVLPTFNASRLIGQSIDQFHKNPKHQADLLARQTTAYTAKLQIGVRHMTVMASPVIDASGTRLGSVAEWTDRTDEVAAQGEIGRLVQGAAAGRFDERLATEGKQGFFLEMAQGLNRLSETTSEGLADVARVLDALSRGDLTTTVEKDYEGVFGQLKDGVNTAVLRLRDVVGQIRTAAEAINTAAREIAVGNQDLSSRTEEQASSLEETASSMEQLNATVKQNAENARQANELAQTSNEVARRGGEMVRHVVDTMGDIEQSSRKISDIIGVIDSIAFQTNILALNAAVEAARAGEQGRGFAVVATEVRNLAHKSATAAKEIKALIAESVGKVEGGAAQVQQAGQTMDEVVSSFRQVAALVIDIAGASREQSSGIEQVTQAVGQMDEVTQQNAALVEQAAAAAESLEEQAGELVKAVGSFKLTGRDGGQSPTRMLGNQALRRL